MPARFRSQLSEHTDSNFRLCCTLSGQSIAPLGHSGLTLWERAAPLALTLFLRPL